MAYELQFINTDVQLPKVGIHSSSQDFIWDSSREVYASSDTYLSLLENGLEIYGTSVGENASGRSTHCKIHINPHTTYFIETFTFITNSSNTKHVATNGLKAHAHGSQVHDSKKLNYENLRKNSYPVGCTDCSQSTGTYMGLPSDNPVLACDIQMDFGKITLHIVPYNHDPLQQSHVWWRETSYTFLESTPAAQACLLDMAPPFQCLYRVSPQTS
ncbi:hypothetical protein K435DRAFT_813491 [Dendrothele bispora CBS 962.96]|uniref:Uncharacterized protein n=1 Tax=Dendrothele bispora (strain CBS 962.96) TaxID=1314807 RepID=A0A4S8KMA5_DENBC|nr:hypothetical protein K435DRAFT_813491 [Dendrothele bispora CBS 962.96]